MKNIEDVTKCQETFSKRRSSLMRKANDVAFSPSAGSISKFSNQRIEEVLHRYVCLPAEARMSHVGDVRRKMEKLLKDETNKLCYLDKHVDDGIIHNLLEQDNELYQFLEQTNYIAWKQFPEGAFSDEVLLANKSTRLSPKMTDVVDMVIPPQYDQIGNNFQTGNPNFNQFGYFMEGEPSNINAMNNMVMGNDNAPNEDYFYELDRNWNVLHATDRQSQSPIAIDPRNEITQDEEMDATSEDSVWKWGDLLRHYKEGNMEDIAP